MSGAITRSHWTLGALCALLCGGLGASVGCDADITPDITPDVTPELSRDQLMDPETCKDCHSTHYDEWSGSMHAYASLDPVFLAMNARGQRETGGELGDFCVQCHAPMALRLGLTTDGLNMADVPAYAQGVTCYFCHTVASVEGTHNNPLTLGDNDVLQGSYSDPTPNTAHASAYSPHLDRQRPESAALCGSCHDIVTQRGVHLERTYAEWRASLFSHDAPGQQQTCGSCHMPGRDDLPATYPEVPVRQVHSHSMAGVDVALTPFPMKSAQRTAVENALNTTVFAELCVASLDGTHRITITLENMAAGHSWPSGSSPDRRGWVEVVARDASDEVLFASGVIEEGQAVSSVEDESLWQLRDFTFDEEGEAAHFFWEVVSYESTTLPAPTANSILDPTYTDIHRTRVYEFSGPPPETVTMQLNLRPIGLEILADLVSTGDLAPEIATAMPTFTLEITRLTWNASDGAACIPVPHN
jgi:hypothetical protein